MVQDFNEFSAIVHNPVERLHLKQFVKTHDNIIAIVSSFTKIQCTCLVTV